MSSVIVFSIFLITSLMMPFCILGVNIAHGTLNKCKDMIILAMFVLWIGSAYFAF